MYPDVPSDSPFPPFGAGHVLVLTILSAVGVLLIAAGRRGGALAECQRLIMGCLLLAQYPIEVVLTSNWGRFSIHESVPLHLCDVLFVLGGLALLTKKELLMDLTYFWGVAGTTQSLFTPVLLGAAPPHPAFVHFFTSHGLGVIAAFYVVLVIGHRPTLKSVGSAMVWANVYVLITGGANAAFENELCLFVPSAGGRNADQLAGAVAVVSSIIGSRRRSSLSAALGAVWDHEPKGGEVCLSTIALSSGRLQGVFSISTNGTSNRGRWSGTA